MRSIGVLMQDGGRRPPMPTSPRKRGEVKSRLLELSDMLSRAPTACANDRSMCYFLPLAAAAIIAILATLHLIYTLRDIVLSPALLRAARSGTAGRHAGDASLRSRRTDAISGPSCWDFHLTHSIGLLLFALLIVLTVVTPLPALKPLMIGARSRS